MKYGVGTDLRTHLKNLAGAFDRIVNLKPFLEVTCQGFLAVHVLACIHGVDGHSRMPVVHGGNDNGINVISFEQLSVIAVGGGFGQSQKTTRGIKPFLPHITDCNLGDVVFTGMLLLAPNVSHSLPAHADVSDGDAIIGADDAAGGGSLVLAVDRRFKRIRGGNDGGRRGRFLQKGPAGLVRLGNRVRCVHGNV